MISSSEIVSTVNPYSRGSLHRREGAPDFRIISSCRQAGKGFAPPPNVLLSKKLPARPN